MTTTITKQDQAVILTGIDGLPPIQASYLSEDGQKLWNSARNEYRILHDELKAYFAGDESLLPKLEGDFKDYMILKRDCCLAFYSLIRDAWEYLKPCYGTDKNGNPLTPGKLLIAILEMESRGMMVPAFVGRCDINPRKSYELRTKIRKAEKGKLREFEVRQLEKDAKNHDGSFHLFAKLEVAILSHCRAAAETNKQIKKQMLRLDDIREELQKHSYKRFNFRKRKAEVWEKGFKITS
jgi:hypothetical protein